MTSQITIIDPSLRRVVVKVTPGKQLSEVRDEACLKLRLDPEQYMLKRNEKQLDLSLTYRLTGLPSGSKLELIQRSKSPSVVSVALQIPAGLATDGLASRLIYKFPSDQTIWQILRTFESGNVDGSGRIWNFTGRSVKTSASENEVYAFPRIHIVGRDYATIEELQKTLAQLGFNDGNVLLKLDLIPTTKSLQQAKQEMDQYFTVTDKLSPSSEAITTTTQLSDITNEASIPQKPSTTTPITSSPSSAQLLTNSRPTKVFHPPSSSTPLAAQKPTPDSAFEPTISLMKQHQISIQAATQNTRLPTDAEIQSASSAAASRLSAIKSIDIKIVFPDQSSVLAPFTNTDTTQDLYTYVRGLLARPDQGFGLSYAGAKGMVLLDEAAGKMLIPDLRFTGNTLIRVMWGDAVGIDIRHSPSLKDDVRKEAMEFVVRSFDDTDADKDERGSSGTAPEVKEDKKSGSGSSGKLPKWLKLPGKK